MLVFVTEALFIIVILGGLKIMQVILTVGPRASGKSTFCNAVIGTNKSVELISRDQILTELFGKTNLSPYDGCHEVGGEKMWEQIEQKICSSSP